MSGTRNYPCSCLFKFKSQIQILPSLMIKPIKTCSNDRKVKCGIFIYCSRNNAKTEQRTKDNNLECAFVYNNEAVDHVVPKCYLGGCFVYFPAVNFVIFLANVHEMLHEEEVPNHHFPNVWTDLTQDQEQTVSFQAVFLKVG